MPTITANKNIRTVQTSASNGAGSTTTSSGLDLRTTIGPHLLTLRMTNGGTTPTVACAANIYTSGDNSTWRLYQGPYQGSLTNSAVVDYSVEIVSGVMYLQVVFSGNTVQAVTVEAYLQELTSYTST